MHNRLVQQGRASTGLLIVIFGMLAVFLSGQMLAGCDCKAGEAGSEMLAEAFRLKDSNREGEALLLFEKVLQVEPDNYQALLNAGYLHFRQGWLYSEKDQKKHHYLTLQSYAERAAALNPTEYQAQLLSLVGKAKTAGYLPPGDQVRVARELETEVGALLAVNGNDPDILYIFSWLNFKVGKTSTLEKLLASVLFGGLPEHLTVERAFVLMHKAMELRPGYLVYYYDTGLFRQRLGEAEMARPWYEKVLAMEAKSAEELVYKQWAEKRMKEIEGLKVASR